MPSSSSRRQKSTVPKESWKEWLPAAAALLLAIACPCLCIYVACSFGYPSLRDKCTGRPTAGLCGTGHRRAMENWRRRKELAKGMKEEMPERLSPSVARKIERRLRLSVGDDGGVVGMGMESRVKKGISLVLGRKRKRASDQMDSVLFGKFPLEVREMIYGYVLAGASHLHIYRRADRRMGHYVCGHTGIGGYGGNLERKSGYCAWEHLPRTLPTGLVWSYDETVTGAWDVRRSARREEDKDDLLGLLLACKRVYLEAIPILYTQNVFSFAEHISIDYFCRTVAPQQLQTIRRIQVLWPMNGWGDRPPVHAFNEPSTMLKFLDDFTGLKELRVMSLNLRVGTEIWERYFWRHMPMSVAVNQI